MALRNVTQPLNFTAAECNPISLAGQTRLSQLIANLAVPRPTAANIALGKEVTLMLRQKVLCSLSNSGPRQSKGRPQGAYILQLDNHGSRLIHGAQAVAAALGVSVQTVYNRLSRAKGGWASFAFTNEYGNPATHRVRAATLQELEQPNG